MPHGLRMDAPGARRRDRLWLPAPGRCRRAWLRITWPGTPRAGGALHARRAATRHGPRRRQPPASRPATPGPQPPPGRPRRRERVIGVLKTAFVQGTLDRDEFDLRVGHTLMSRTYADLAAITADLPTRSCPRCRHGGPCPRRLAASGRLGRASRAVPAARQPSTARPAAAPSWPSRPCSGEAWAAPWSSIFFPVPLTWMTSRSSRSRRRAHSRSSSPILSRHSVSGCTYDAGGG